MKTRLLTYIWSNVALSFGLHTHIFLDTAAHHTSPQSLGWGWPCLGLLSPRGAQVGRAQLGSSSTLLAPFYIQGATSAATTSQPMCQEGLSQWNATLLKKHLVLVDKIVMALSCMNKLWLSWITFYHFIRDRDQSCFIILAIFISTHWFKASKPTRNCEHRLMSGEDYHWSPYLLWPWLSETLLLSCNKKKKFKLTAL